MWQIPEIYFSKNVDGIINSALGLIPVRIQDEDEDYNFAINGLNKCAQDKGLVYKIMILRQNPSHLFDLNDKFSLYLENNVQSINQSIQSKLFRG